MCLRRLSILFVFLVAGAGVATAGPNVAIDNILMSKVNGVTKVEIWPGCTMRYIDHSPTTAGLEVRIRVAAGPECTELLDAVASERYSPSSLRLGNVEEVIFDRFSNRDTYITLKFLEPQKFEIRQHQVGWIEVFVDTTVASASLPASRPDPIAAQTQPPPPVVPGLRPQVQDRRTVPAQRTSRPTTRVNVPPSNTGDIVIQLGVFSNAAPAIAELARTNTPHFAYTTEFDVNATTWEGLALGFFTSEDEAAAVLASLAASFPDAWIRFVSDEERELATAGGEARDRLANDIPAVRMVAGKTLSPPEADSALADGRRAILERRYPDAVRLYTDVLESAGHSHGPEAREMLGIALERSGRTTEALAEYEAFGVEYPEHMLASRVDERRRALETAMLESRSTTVSAPAPVIRQDGGWEFRGGISHYYWRNQEQIVHDGNYRVSSSGVLGLADITATRRGERFDVLARVNAAYQHNLVEFDRTGDIGWVSDAFVDVRDKDWGWQGRIGRQSRREDGVPGRFDGAGIRYFWKDDLSFSVSAGVPFDSPRFVSDSSRGFVAASARASSLWDGRVSASAYTHQQTADGIYDRQAVGGEVVYRAGRLATVALVDFDVSYNVLNTFLLNSSWRLDNGWTLSGRVDVGALPYLMTRNALIGQSASSIDELLETYTEGQVRRLARDRTAQSTTLSAGLSMPFGERFDLSFDVSMRQAEATVASGGVAAVPDTGAQLFLNAMAVGTGLLRDNDLWMLSLRSDSTLSRDTQTIIADGRLPFGRALRINPRVTVARHTPNQPNASEQTVITPALRILWRWKNLLVDLEAGARWSNRELPFFESDPFTPDGTEELRGGFVNLGYRLEF